MLVSELLKELETAVIEMSESSQTEGDFVWITPIGKEEVKQGFHIPTDHQDRSCFAKVISDRGPGYWNEDGYFIPSQDVRCGDVVLMAPFAGFETPTKEYPEARLVETRDIWVALRPKQ